LNNPESGDLSEQNIIVPRGLIETDDFIDESLSRPLQIAYQDDNYVAVFKPAGLVVHRSKMTQPHEPVLLQSLRDQLNRFVYPIHRLDRPTAGLILFALSGQAAAKMVEQFTNRTVTKHYQALVRGFAPESGTIDRPLREKYGEELFPDSTADNPTQEAVTQFDVLAKYQVPWPAGKYEETRFSLLEIRPLTGRWHQIRRHLNHIAYPVIGDHRHGDHRYNQMVFAQTGVYRMLLTAMRLDFRHPYTGELHSILVNRGSEFDKIVHLLEPFAIQPGPTTGSVG
jgi:tRNA pseudouridine65 synthase